MKFHLPNDIFLKIYSFVGHNALYFDKNHFIYLKELRRKYIENPILIKYKLVEWKYPGNKIILNKYSKQLRPKMKVNNNSNYILVGSRIFIGEIIKKGNIFQINPSLHFKRKFIEKNLLLSNVTTYVNTKVFYIDVFKMWCFDKRINYFKDLWIK